MITSCNTNQTAKAKNNKFEKKKSLFLNKIDTE